MKKTDEINGVGKTNSGNMGPGRTDKGQIRFDNLTSLRKAIMVIKKQLGDFKLSISYLQKLSQRSEATAGDIAAEIRLAIISANDIEAFELFDACDDELKSWLIIPGTELNIEISGKLNLGGEEAAAAFINRHGLAGLEGPKSAPGGGIPRTLPDNSLSENAARLMENLNPAQAEKMLARLDNKIIYFIVADEIEYFIDDSSSIERELLAAISLGEKIPAALNFLTAVRHKCPLIYQHIILEINSRGWIEFRHLFHKPK